MSRSRILAYVFGVLLVASVVVFATVEPLRWRGRVIALHLAGEIPDISLREMFVYSLPGSDQVMSQLIERRNPYAVIRNAKTSNADVAAGSRIFQENCSSCHGHDGAGSRVAPALVDREFKHGDSDWAVYRTIRDGVSGTAMPRADRLDEGQRWQVIAFVRSLGVPRARADSAGSRVDPDQLVLRIPANVTGHSVLS